MQSRFQHPRREPDRNPPSSSDTRAPKLPRKSFRARDKLAVTDRAASASHSYFVGILFGMTADQRKNGICAPMTGRIGFT